MNRKKLLITAISATLLAAAAGGASFAASRDHGGMGGPGRFHAGMAPEVVYVRMLKQFDTNSDMKISKDEVKAGVDTIFDKADANKDGQITPGELRTYRTERFKAWRAEHDKAAAGDNDANKPQDEANADEQTPRRHHGHGGQRGHMMREARMMQATMFFHRVDKDENGQISKQEAEDAANRMFDRMDRNHDGVISLDDMPSRPVL